MKELTQNTYEDETKTGKVVVDFWAEWCGPCKMLAPIFEELDEEMSDVTFAKVNVDDNQDLSGEKGVRGIPTILLLKDGEEVDRIVGFKPKDALKQNIENAFA
mgnify:CR=1 FL=1